MLILRVFLYTNKNECFILHHKMQRLLFILILSTHGLLCNAQPAKWKQTQEGIYYKIFTKDSNALKPDFGDHIWMHLRKLSSKNKEIFNTKVFDTKEGVDMDFKTPLKKTDVTYFFSLMGKGDSAVIKIPIKYVDNNKTATGYYTYILNLINFQSKFLYDSTMQAHFRRQRISDSLTIIDYLRNKNIMDATADTFGNWFICTQHGTGKQIKIGDSVEIHYIGKLINGDSFDNSYSRKQMLPFKVGGKQVIDGLDKGITNFNFGDKGMLIIPSRLAYKDKEVGKIPPNSILIFEVEIIK